MCHTRPFNWLCGRSRFIHRYLFLHSRGQFWNVSGYGTRIFLGTRRCALQILIYKYTSHNFFSRCGTKGTVSILCGPREAGTTYCRASRDECRQMVCFSSLAIINTQPYSLVARWSCIVPWSPPMKTSISGQISPGWRKRPNTPTVLVTGALFTFKR